MALHAREALDLAGCVRCGLCVESCHYVRAGETDPRATPAYKVKLAGQVLRARDVRTATHRDEWIDELFGRCTVCGRCRLHCTVGIDVPRLVSAARGVLTAAGLIPHDLQNTVDTGVSSGNSMGIARHEWIETVRWLEEELQADIGDPAARLPIDEPGADFLYTVNPREPKFFPLSLTAVAAIFHAAGARWTLSSDWYDVTNYGMYAGDQASAAIMASRLRRAMHHLGARTLVLGECGHGFNANRWLSSEWIGAPPDFPVISILQLVDRWVREGRLTLDPNRNGQLATLHDPCNLARHGGIIEEPRALLAASVAAWVEMTPSREQNFCCGGGGGQLAMSRYADRRRAAGRVKADQIRQTGARVVAAPCHNCIDQLQELNREYALGVDVKTVCELVANALVWPEH
jgi:Fe-S oxidoreductase